MNLINIRNFQFPQISQILKKDFLLIANLASMLGIVLAREKMSEAEKKSITLNLYQDKFLYSDYKFNFLKSGWGTGKSLALIIAATEESRNIKDNLGVIFRKEFTDLQDSTCVDFESFTRMKIDSHRNVKFKNHSTIMFRHIEELNNLGNINLGWFGIEQAEELETDKEFLMLFGRLRRKGCSLKGYIISNAKGHNWIYKIKQTGLYPLDKDGNEDRRPELRLDQHLEATTFDNAHNTDPTWLASLGAIKIRNPQMYNRFVLNSDADEDTIDIIIKAKDVERAIGRQVKKYEQKIRRAVIIDPARYGDDETVLYGFENNKMIAIEYYNQKSTMETAGYASILAEKIKANTIAGDSIGVGSGIFDRLREIKKHKVIEICSSGKSSDPKKYRNIRAEMWCKAGEKFENDLPNIISDDIMQDQLSIVRYKTVESNGCRQVESKEDIKKRLGRSPDRADCCVMGLYVIDQCEPVEVRDRYRIDVPRRNRFNSETC